MSIRFLHICLVCFALDLKADTACVGQPILDFASLERQIWQAYYDGELQKAPHIVTLYIKEFFCLDDDKALELTPAFLKIWVVFHSIHVGAVESVYNAEVLPLLENFFKQVSLSVSYKMNAVEAAKKELAWWIARRNPNTCSIENVAKLMAQAMSAMFGRTPAEYERTAYLRTAAVRLRDKCQNEWGGIRSEDWQMVENLLRQAYDTCPALTTCISKEPNGTSSNDSLG